MSDFQDVNLMYAGKLKAKIAIFDPAKIFDSIKCMFETQAQLEGTRLSFQTMSH